MECCMTRCVSCCMSCDWILANTHTLCSEKKTFRFPAYSPQNPISLINISDTDRRMLSGMNLVLRTVLSTCSCLNHDTCYQPPQCCVLWTYNFSRNNVIMVTVIISCLLPCSPVLSVIVGRSAYCFALDDLHSGRWRVDVPAGLGTASPVTCSRSFVTCSMWTIVFFCYNNIQGRPKNGATLFEGL